MRLPWLGLLSLIVEGPLSPKGMRVRPSPEVEVRGSGRERASRDQHWRKVDEATVHGGKVMVTSYKMRLGVGLIELRSAGEI